MTLYDINEEMRECIRYTVDPETGEVLGEEIDYNALRQLEMEKDAKCDNICAWAKEYDASAEVLAAEIARLQARKKSCERNAFGLRQYLAAGLQGKNRKTARYSMHFRKGIFLDVVDRKRVPMEYKKERISMEPDTEKIRQAYMDGKSVPGIQVRHYAVTIR